MTRAIKLAVLVLATAVPAARAAAVKYFDRATGKDVTLGSVAIVRDGPEGLTVKVRTKTQKISALDIREVLYNEEEVKPVDFQTYRAPFGKLDRANLPGTKDADRPKLYKEALAAFAELLPKLPPTSKIKAYVQFKAAETAYRLGLAEPARQDDALAALGKFCAEHQEGWQIARALTLLAQMQEDRDDLKAVQKTYERLAAVPGISAETRATSLLNAARTLIKTENFAAAEAKLQELQKAPLDKVAAGKVQVYLAQCQILGNDPARAAAAEKQLRQLLSPDSDASLKALIHNTIGDYYTKKNQLDEAFWEYLRVDVLYNGDRFEHARALYNLARLYRDQRKDAERADKCLEALKDKRFTGLEFQKKAAQK